MIRSGDAAALDALLEPGVDVGLACHVNPDGDALGSMLAARLALVRRGHPVAASFPAPFKTADIYRFLPGIAEVVPPAAFPAAPSVMMVFDCGSLSRLHELTPAAEAAGALVVLDHHATNERFGKLNFVHPEAAATTQIVYWLMRELGWEIDRDVATCLYAGLAMDTGRFQFPNTNADVFRLAAELADTGVEVAAVSRAMFSEVSLGYLRLLAQVLERAGFDAHRRLVWTSVTLADLDRHGVGPEETDEIVDVLRGAREADVAAVFKEVADHGVRVSLRSRPEIDVGAVAAANGGGGHRNAAGFVAASFDDALARVVAGMEGQGAVGDGGNGQ